jgi:hypothetical protein
MMVGKTKSFPGDAARNVYVVSMKLPVRNVFIPALAVTFVVAMADTALARPKKPRAERPPQPALIQEEHGTPIIMQGLEWPKRPAGNEDRPRQRAERPRTIPRGSSTSIGPPVPSPGVPSAIAPQPSVGVYKPPPINSFGDRVTGCLHSFPLNAGLGNNPTNRDFYVRSCANN